MAIEVGSVLEGVVAGITNFGAFVELEGGKTGLVHISEVASVYVKEVRDFLSEGDKVKVKVLNIDGNGKIGLSIKQAEEKKEEAPQPVRNFAKGGDFKRGGRGTSPSFEDKLSRFLKDSDERLTDLRRKTDSKRGGRGSRRD